MKNPLRFWNERRLQLKDNLDSKRLPCCVAIPESKFVENVGGIIRTANAFLIQEVVLDQKVYNKAATAGTAKWENINVVEDVMKFIKEKGYVSIALEQHERSIPLWDFEFPQNSAIVIGHEVEGMKDEMVEQCDFVIEIPQFGLVESLNVSTATSIALYEYSRQHRK
ncbi:MAG: TrmH family RNA methyltransferase [Candidatus Caenarcaniphilales bacterium]|nr:TrmH family RNA methyltransferase [Candidatus Caenarcaniphilales bacterium]